MALKSPGVEVLERDFSASTPAAGTSTAGFVGVFEKGPVGTAILVTSLADAERKLGGYLDGYYGMFALKNFFENGGALAWVVRVAHYVTGVSQAATATVNVSDRAGVPVPTLQVSAASPGTWGNGISVEIAESAAYPTTGFTLLVKRGTTVLERFADLLIGAANVVSDDYVEKKINGVSAYVSVRDLASVTVAPNNRPAVGTLALASGSDGLTGLVTGDFLGSAADGNGLRALDPVDVNFVAIPGEADTASAATLANGLIAYCETRTDCVAIIEAPPASNAAKLVDFRKGQGSFAHAAFNSSYGAGYGPWLNTTHPVTGRNILVPPSGCVAGVYARSDRAAGGPWASPAGLNRGGLRGIISPEYRFSEGEMGLLYEAGWNPIAVVTNTLIINGQKTLQLKESATNRVNVRRLMAFLEKSVKDAAQFLVHEPNVKSTWEAFKRTVGPFLTGVRDKGGLVGFEVICDETVNTPDVRAANQMLARIRVVPPLTAEFLTVEFNIADQATFSEL